MDSDRSLTPGVDTVEFRLASRKMSRKRNPAIGICYKLIPQQGIMAARDKEAQLEWLCKMGVTPRPVHVSIPVIKARARRTKRGCQGGDFTTSA
jgi:hypothetical protein